VKARDDRFFLSQGWAIHEHPHLPHLRRQAEIPETAIAQDVRAFRRRLMDARDTTAVFPHESHKALAEAGWLALPLQEATGRGLGITEAP